MPEKSIEAQIERMTALAEQAIEGSRKREEEQRRADILLAKISTKQDAIAERLADGKGKFAEIGEDLKAHGVRLTALETFKTEATVTAKTVKSLAQVAWLLLGAVAAGGITLASILLKVVK